jgi:hypothetical protein
MSICLYEHVHHIWKNIISTNKWRYFLRYFIFNKNGQGIRVVTKYLDLWLVLENHHFCFQRNSYNFTNILNLGLRAFAIFESWKLFIFASLKIYLRVQLCGDVVTLCTKWTCLFFRETQNATGMIHHTLFRKSRSSWFW